MTTRRSARAKGVIRVLMVEDSPICSDALTTLFESDPRVLLVGLATNGADAVHLAARLHPDVITMDVNMPVMGGLEAIERIMATSPTPILVLTSDERGPTGELSFEALRRGAIDLMLKPSAWPVPRHERVAILERLKLLASVPVVRHIKGRDRGEVPSGETSSVGDGLSASSNSVAHVEESESLGSRSVRGSTQQGRDNTRQARTTKKAERTTRLGATPSTLSPGVSRGAGGVPVAGRAAIIGIVASTGGPAALAQVMESISEQCDVPILVVQHLAGGFAETLAAWLNRVTSLPVCLARDGEKVRGGGVWIAPDNAHLVVRRAGELALEMGPPVVGHRPSGSRLLTSIARAYGHCSAGIVLTGMGSDGAAGLLDMHRAGAWTIAQEPSSAVVYGMPQSAIDLGAAHFVLPLDEVSASIARAVHGDDPTRSSGGRS